MLWSALVSSGSVSNVILASHMGQVIDSNTDSQVSPGLYRSSLKLFFSNRVQSSSIIGDWYLLSSIKVSSSWLVYVRYLDTGVP